MKWPIHTTQCDFGLLRYTQSCTWAWWLRSVRREVVLESESNVLGVISCSLKSNQSPMRQTLCEECAARDRCTWYDPWILTKVWIVIKLFCILFRERQRMVFEMKFTIQITETLQMLVDADAHSPEEAERLVRRQYRLGEFVLDASKCTGAEFAVVETPSNRF